MPLFDEKGAVKSEKWIREQKSRINCVLDLFDIGRCGYVKKESVNYFIFYEKLNSLNI
jgi:hypothetical protein